jgi:hypothetical protein
MRVIVTPADAAPTEIAHPALFLPKPGAAELAAARAEEAEEAAKKANQARLIAVSAAREAARATMAVRTAENLKRRAEAEQAAAEKALAAATSTEKQERAREAVAKAASKVEELQARLSAANADVQPKLDAVVPAREVAVAAEAARAAAADVARELARAQQPVSVFISRKTQRLYVRRAFQPVLETAVTIRDPERPIGTHVFTAMEQTNGNTAMRWSVVSLDGARSRPETTGLGTGNEGSSPEATAKEPSDAIAALDRIVLSPEVRRLTETASARSSLIISDEELSSETGKGTDFVVLLNGEPLGGIAMRRHRPSAELWYGRPRFFRLPFWR